LVEALLLRVLAGEPREAFGEPRAREMSSWLHRGPVDRARVMKGSVREY